MNILIDKAINYLLILICLTAISGAVIYRVYALNNIGVIISLSVVIILFIIILLLEKKYKDKPIKIDHESANNNSRTHSNINTNTSNFSLLTSRFLLLASYFLFLVLNFYTLFKYSTDASIISPWSVLPGYFFLLYALATLILLIILYKYSENKDGEAKNFYFNFLISTHYFLSFSAALIIYKIGFGFDPFVHTATIDIINEKGFVDPKPFYYLGHYSIIIIFHKLTAVPIVLLQKLLVPFLAALFLPHFLFKTLKKLFSFSTAANLSLVVLLIIPFSFFIVSTPQNLAYLSLLLALIIGLKCKNIIDLIYIYLLSLAALATQPIAGIPALMFALMFTVYHSDIITIKRNLYRIIFFLNAAALPGAFYVLNRTNVSNTGNTAEIAAAKSLPALSSLVVPGQENFILNFIYLYAFNIKTVIGALILTGFIIAWRHRNDCKVFSVYLTMSASVFISYLLTRQLPFNFLIYYERDNFTDRILFVSILFLFPFILLAIYGIITAILKQNKFIIYSWLVFICMLIATSFYISYPRLDNYYNSHGYSTGANDIAAVKWINNNTEGDYIVLANQQVSAAALQQFGFLKYYQSQIGNRKSEIYYYPIPTGGPLYGFYLDMVNNKPSRDTILAAMDLTGVNTAYFVLNRYWWAFPKILDEARLEADSWQEFNNEVFVFKYSRN